LARFETWIELGPDATDATIAHEAAHWVMEARGAWNGDLSVHDPARPSRPGVAYTEGWATYLGQATLSWIDGEDRPVARFGPVVVDLERATVDGAPAPPPEPDDGRVDAWLTETAVAATLWAIRAEVGDGPILAGLGSLRLRELDRGYPRTDLIDLLDALSCEGLVAEELLREASARFSVPWRAEERACL
jgi:hypothetical protein